MCRLDVVYRVVTRRGPLEAWTQSSSAVVTVGARAARWCAKWGAGLSRRRWRRGGGGGSDGGDGGGGADGDGGWSGSPGSGRCWEGWAYPRTTRAEGLTSGWPRGRFQYHFQASGPWWLLAPLRGLQPPRSHWLTLLKNCCCRHCRTLGADFCHCRGPGTRVKRMTENVFSMT